MKMRKRRSQRLRPDEQAPVLLTEGPFAGCTVEFATSDGVEADEEAVDALMALMGIEPVFLSDLSTIGDFMSFRDDAEQPVMPVPLHRDMTILEAIAAIREQFPNWPRAN